jgi:hypothetical protein
VAGLVQPAYGAELDVLVRAEQHVRRDRLAEAAAEHGAQEAVVVLGRPFEDRRSRPAEACRRILLRQDPPGPAQTEVDVSMLVLERPRCKIQERLGRALLGQIRRHELEGQSRGQLPAARSTQYA